VAFTAGLPARGGLAVTRLADVRLQLESAHQLTVAWNPHLPNLLDPASGQQESAPVGRITIRGGSSGLPGRPGDADRCRGDGRAGPGLGARRWCCSGPGHVEGRARTCS
jgi:hypothetical protein